MAIQRLTCTPRSLPRSKWTAAAEHASFVNPANRAPVERLMRAMSGFVANPMRISVLTQKYWGAGGVKLTVGFLDTPPADLRQHILLHMNAWSKFANVVFTESRTDPDVRIARDGGQNGGYWSYVGTDIQHIDKDKPTMNLEAFTMETPESEFVRVVRHETGHTLGCPHEHMRDELVARVDREKAIKYFMATQGWSRDEVIAQVLTPISKGSLWGTTHADQKSIMCYQIPGTLTKDGKPILGGLDIDPQDADFVGSIYPKKTQLTRPPQPGRAGKKRKSTRKKTGATRRRRG
jgi:hypothetical protein